MGRAVLLNIGAVDGSAFSDRTGPRKRLDQVSPEPFARPTVEAVVDRRRRAIVGPTQTSNTLFGRTNLICNAKSI